MSLFGAMTTSVSGLRAQSYALENISDNVANSQTVGYKRVDTSFMDMVPDYPLTQQVGGTVMAFARGTNTITGNFVGSGISTNMGITGDSFFVVRKAIGTVDGEPVFAVNDLYTRRGDFNLDKDGYLVNGAGRYLIGNALDPVTGAAMGAPKAIQLTAGVVPARASSVVEYMANLPSVPKTASYDASVPGSDLYTGPTAVTPALESAFIKSTSTGGSLTYYDGVGTPTTVEMRWAKTATNTWNLYYQNPAYDATTSPNKWIAAGGATPTPFVFNSVGQLTAPTGGSTPLTGLTVGTTTLNLDFSKGLTQFNDTSSGGGVNVRVLKQDGYAAGTVNNVSVMTDGRIVASYSNGVTSPLAQVAFAHFNAPNSLKREDGSTFSTTLEAGTPLGGLNGGSVMGGQLEGSNTDISEEFSKMIITQQAYSANTKIITTVQQMMQDTVNIIR
ncbi:flagellar hook protein FlgE [Alsobacter sp. SYSU BS001988]|jgi:flagellar hook protein FlgE